MIALSINNWNEYRKDRIKERKVLQEIVLTIDSNDEELKNRLFWVKKFQQSSQIIMEVLEDRIPYSDTLGRHFSQARWSGMGNLAGLFSEAGYSALKMTGYDIIRSDLLKREILKMFETTLPVLVEADVSTNNKTNLQEYYLRNFKDGGEVPLNFDALKRDNYFLQTTGVFISFRRRIIGRMEEYLEQSNKLLENLAEELTKLE